MIKPKLLATNITIDDRGPFNLYKLNDFDFSENIELKEDMGVYIFTTRSKKIDGKIGHIIHYVGKTIDYGSRFNNHHKAQDLKKVHPNCLAIHECEEDEMDALEIELIERWKPELNEKFANEEIDDK